MSIHPLTISTDTGPQILCEGRAVLSAVQLSARRRLGTDSRYVRTYAEQQRLNRNAEARRLVGRASFAFLDAIDQLAPKGVLAMSHHGISTRCDLGERQVRRNLAKLESHGLVEAIRTPGRITVYVIIPVDDEDARLAAQERRRIWDAGREDRLRLSQQRRREWAQRRQLQIRQLQETAYHSGYTAAAQQFLPLFDHPAAEALTPDISGRDNSFPLLRKKAIFDTIPDQPDDFFTRNRVDPPPIIRKRRV